MAPGLQNAPQMGEGGQLLSQGQGINRRRPDPRQHRQGPRRGRRSAAQSQAIERSRGGRTVAADAMAKGQVSGHLSSRVATRRQSGPDVDAIAPPAAPLVVLRGMQRFAPCCSTHLATGPCHFPHPPTAGDPTVPPPRVIADPSCRHEDPDGPACRIGDDVPFSGVTVHGTVSLPPNPVVRPIRPPFGARRLRASRCGCRQGAPTMICTRTVGVCLSPPPSPAFAPGPYPLAPQGIAPPQALAKDDDDAVQHRQIAGPRAATASGRAGAKTGCRWRGSIRSLPKPMAPRSDHDGPGCPGHRSQDAHD